MNNPDAERAFARERRDVDEREWLVTNGIGGYASGTVSGKITRRFHGWLIAALPAPQGRTMMLNKLAEVVEVGTKKVRLSVPSEGQVVDHGGLALAPLHSFRLDQGLPVWTYAIDGALLERRAWMAHGQNTTYIAYHLQRGAAAPLRLELEPWVNFRPHEGPVDAKPEGPYALTVVGSRFEIGAPGLTAALRLRVVGEEASFAIDNSRVKQMHYPLEDSRGYDADGGLYSIGFFRVTLVAGGTASLQATAEAWEETDLLDADGAASCETTRRSRLLHRAGAVVKDDMDARLVFAADQFLVSPVGRTADRARARARGDDVRTVIAGYPWFTDWGRDTMISLEGLALATGRHEEAKYVLRTFAHFVRHGLIPNLFPERGNAGLYHTADASLWFFHAVDRYLAYTRDDFTLEALLPTLLEIADCHERGTDFGIVVDPADGLLRQGADGYQLTWMDAKLGDLVVTPRRGKAVEINALYYNALRLLEGWTRRFAPDRTRALGAAADRLRTSFNARFWNAAGGYLYDVVDCEAGGDDPAFRPNQLLAVALPNAVLAEDRWEAVVGRVREKLLTPVGLRSLSPDDPEYKAKYFGDLRSRDLAYHQGTVWPWLIGPFIDAWLRVHPDDPGSARPLLDGFAAAIEQGCVGTIGEIFDGSAPFAGRGCFAQAWSVAEVLRCRAKIAGVIP